MLRHLRRAAAGLASVLALGFAGSALAEPALWAIKDQDSTIYLFGTVHALPKDAQWFSGPVERAYKASDELVTEIPMDDTTADAQAIAARALLPKGQSLRDMMAPAQRMKFEEVLVGLGLPVEAMDRFEPWYAAMTLSLLPVMQSGYDPQTGAEAKLTAEADGKQKAALETASEMWMELMLPSRPTVMPLKVRSPDAAMLNKPSTRPRAASGASS